MIDPHILITRYDQPSLLGAELYYAIVMDFLLSYALLVRKMSIKHLDRMASLKKWFQYTLRAKAIVQKQHTWLSGAAYGRYFSR
jgi:hypothetical protein